MDEQTNLVPEWVDGKKINEARFCREFLKDHPMIAVDGTFFCTVGRIADVLWTELSSARRDESLTSPN